MVNFNFNFDPGTSLQQMIGFEMAGRVWSTYLTDPITVNLQVGVSSKLGSKVIGGALPGIKSKASYADFYSRLVADASSADDQTAIKNLQGTSTFANSWFCTGSMQNTSGGHGFNYQTTQLNLTRANARALGIDLGSTSTTGLDGYIVFSDLASAKTAAGTPVVWSYDYTRATTQTSNSLDFLSTAIHEIGHILGFTSSIDAPGWLNPALINTDWTTYEQSLSKRAQNANPLDLFRYSQDTDGYSAIDLAIGGTNGSFFSKYFSIDGGTTAISKFAAGSDLTLMGDGYQASHWAAGANGIMGPTLKTGTRSAIATTDLKAMDAIGWNLASAGINTAVNLTLLQTQSRQALAGRLGKTETWLNANATTAAQQLAKDGTLAIFAMIVNSGIYDLSRITPPTTGGTASLTFSQLFEERGLFESIDELQVVPAAPIQFNLDGLLQGTTSNLSGMTPLTPGGTVSLITDLFATNRSHITSLTPGSAPSATVTPSGSLNQSSQRLMTGSASLVTGQPSYFFGSSEPTAYKGTPQPDQPSFQLPPVLVDLTTTQSFEIYVRPNAM